MEERGGLVDVMDEHPWKKGDLCKHWVGVICRVVQVKKADPTKPPGSRQRVTRLKLVQACPFFGELKKSAVVPAYKCKPLSLVELGTEYMRLGNFIREEAEKRGM